MNKKADDLCVAVKKNAPTALGVDNRKLEWLRETVSVIVMESPDEGGLEV